MTGEFARDDAWQTRIAAKFLDPMYELFRWRVRRYPGDHPQQRKHVDVLLTSGGKQERVDRKNHPGRSRDGLPATKISYETMSCTTPGAEKARVGRARRRKPLHHSSCLLCRSARPRRGEPGPESERSIASGFLSNRCATGFGAWTTSTAGSASIMGSETDRFPTRVPINAILDEFPEANRFTASAPLLDSFRTDEAQIASKLDAALQALEDQLPKPFEWLPDSLMDEIVARRAHVWASSPPKRRSRDLCAGGERLRARVCLRDDERDTWRPARRGGAESSSPGSKWISSQGRR